MSCSVTLGDHMIVIMQEIKVNTFYYNDFNEWLLSSQIYF